MKRITFLLILLITSLGSILAQDDYTYISDRKFFRPDNLIGYDFRPNYMEVPNEGEQELSPGEYSFGISKSNLYVDGGDIKGVYSVNNINPTEYGYKLLLMNARDPTIQGHLKVILNKKAQVEALVFKRSNKEVEMIFFLAPIPKPLREKETSYFTGRYDLELPAQDSIWGQKVYPFMRVHYDEGGVQERLQAADSTSIEFIEKITVIEKKKKKKRKNRKQKNEVDEIETQEGEVETEVVVEEVEAEVAPQVDPGAYPPVEAAESVEAAVAEEQEEVVKVKIIKEYFVKVRTIVTFEDGQIEDRVEEIPIKKKFALFETETNNDPTIAPFELEIYPKKGKPIIMRLTGKKTISSIQIEGKDYLMRGH